MIVVSLMELAIVVAIALGNSVRHLRSAVE